MIALPPLQELRFRGWEGRSEADSIPLYTRRDAVNGRSLTGLVRLRSFAILRGAGAGEPDGLTGGPGQEAGNAWTEARGPGPLPGGGSTGAAQWRLPGPGGRSGRGRGGRGGLCLLQGRPVPRLSLRHE